ncbi:MAG: hypothetical protein K8S87_01400 [Planctomycetes bacterium]|nr:hypothetical protein [Planctomycetota bacterium]
MIERLKFLGFSDNESKVYLELLKCFPATAYQIAKRTGLAGANVYQVLATLVKKGFVTETDGEKKLYTPIDPKSWVDNKKKEFSENIDVVARELDALFETPKEDYLIYRLKNEAAVARKIQELIESAEVDIYFDLFPKNFRIWKNKLIDATNKGIFVKGTVYEKFDHNFDNLMLSLHPLADLVLKEHNNDLFSILIDAREAIFGLFAKDGSLKSCFWSRNLQLCLQLESGMRSEMMHWFLLQNIDINKVLDKENLEFYSKLRNPYALQKRMRKNGKPIK